MKILRFIKTHYLAVILIIALFLLGREIYRDYGIPWDEKAQIDIARVNYDYIVKGNPELLTFTDRYYGPFFEVGIYYFLKDLSPSDYYYARHLAIYSINLIGLLAFYFLAFRLFKRRGWALLACVLLIVSPRIFADSLYNAKDIPLMDAYIFAVATLFVITDALKNKRRPGVTFIMAGAHAVTTAIALSTRISGLVIVLLTGIGFFLLLLQNRAEWKRLLLVFGVYIIGTLGFTMMFWPILWHDPLRQISNALIEMNARPYKSINLYIGQLIPGQNLPWHYLPVWIGITTPILVVCGFVITHLWAGITGAANIARRQFGCLIKANSAQINDWLVIFGWLYLPVLAVIAMRTTLYDGWRHAFFIYPAGELIAVWGMRRIWQFMSARFPGKVAVGVAGLIMLVGILEPVFFMVKNHPYENIYFNFLAGNPATLRQKYELDYWGLSYKQALDYILENDPSPEIKVYLENSPGKSYIRLMLPSEIASRFKIVDSPERANYYVSNYRGHPQDYPFPEKYYSIVVRGTEIMVVYKLK